MSDYKGFSALGELVGGGQGGGTSDAYIDGMRTGYDTQRAGYSMDKARDEARISASMAMARESLPQFMADEGYRPVDSAVMGSNRTVSFTQLADFARPQTAGALEAADAALTDGNLPGYNARMAQARGKEYAPYSLAGGGSAVFRADTGDADMTALGESKVITEQLRAVAQEASAAASQGRAKAAESLAGVRDRTDPNRPRGKANENPAVAEASTDMPAPKSAADFAKLPPGTRFLAPDGTVRIKP